MYYRVHRLPGLETSKNRYKPQEDIMYDEMMFSLLEIVLEPVLCSPNGPDKSSFELIDRKSNRWEFVRLTNTEQPSSSEKWKNLLNWKAFTKKNRDTIMLEV